MHDPETSVIIPCWNAANVIADTLEALLRFSREKESAYGGVEILVVDDGSTDSTAGIVRGRFPSVRLIQMARNAGKGAAVRRGMLEARGTCRVFVDADLPFGAEAIERIIDPLRNENMDACMGKRVPTDQWPSVHRTRIRLLASRVFSSLVAVLTGDFSHDTQCGLKGFRNNVAEYLFGASTIDGFAFDVEIVYLVLLNELRFRHVPVHTIASQYTTVSILRNGPGMLRDTLRVFLNHWRRRYPLMSPPPETPSPMEQSEQR